MSGNVEINGKKHNFNEWRFKRSLKEHNERIYPRYEDNIDGASKPNLIIDISVNKSQKEYTVSVMYAGPKKGKELKSIVESVVKKDFPDFVFFDFGL